MNHYLDPALAFCLFNPIIRLKSRLLIVELSIIVGLDLTTAIIIQKKVININKCCIVHHRFSFKLHQVKQALPQNRDRGEGHVLGHVFLQKVTSTNYTPLISVRLLSNAGSVFDL